MDIVERLESADLDHLWRDAVAEICRARGEAARLKQERDHWFSLVSQADQIQFPFQEI